jgi:hypothetical protein
MTSGAGPVPWRCAGDTCVSAVKIAMVDAATMTLKYLAKI